MQKVLISPRKVKNLQKTFSNIKVTLVCGIITILVLRGTIGIGGGLWATLLLDPPSSVYMRDHFSFMEANRLLSEIPEEGIRQQLVEDEEEATELPFKEPYSMGPRIGDWDTQRHAWLVAEQHSELTSHPYILLVTSSPPKPCGRHVGDHYLLKFIKNKIDYVRAHSMEIFYSMAQLDPHMEGSWSKLPLLRRLMLTHPEMEWLWWMDNNAVFTDMSFEVPWKRYKEHNLVLHGWEEEVHTKEARHEGPNTGSFLLRNCQWSLDLLDVWVRRLFSETLDTGRPPADDQSALTYLLNDQKETWGSKVYLENKYYLHGYWVDLVERFDDLMMSSHPGYGDDRWPFITHFVGCKLCGSSGGDYPDDSQRCLKHMERSFNLGDNQILQRYGYEHVSLNNFKVRKSSSSFVKVQNDTSSQILEVKA